LRSGGIAARQIQRFAPSVVPRCRSDARALRIEISRSTSCIWCSSDVSSGVRSPTSWRVKGVKKLGVRLGNWLSAKEARDLWQSPDAESLKGKRDRAIIAVLLGCGLRRRELADLSFDHLQRREDRWAIVDLIGKGGHVRTVPVPDWVKHFLDEWFTAARIASGRLFRCVCRSGTVWGDRMTEKVVWHVVKLHAKKLDMPKLAPHDPA
jgi:site-specific recombinase XerD